MRRIMYGFATASAMLLAGDIASAADLGGPRLSIKDSGHDLPQHSCGSNRFGGLYIGATAGLTGLNSSWEETFADFNDYQTHPLKTTRVGGSGGVTLGYNRVLCNFLLGVETDFNFAGAGGSTNHFPTFPTAGAGYAKITDAMRNYATLRGRVGIISDRTLYFATAGFAWARLNHKFEDFGHFDGGPTNPGFIAPDFNSWKLGYVVGGGFETALTELVSLKAEASYMGFGKRTYSFLDNSGAGPDFYAFKTQGDAFTARLGLNVKLGGVSSASYSPPMCSDGSSPDGAGNCCPAGTSANGGGVCCPDGSMAGGGRSSAHHGSNPACRAVRPLK